MQVTRLLSAVLYLLMSTSTAAASEILQWTYPGATLEIETESNFESVEVYTGPMASKFEAGAITTIDGTKRSALYLTSPDRSVLEVFRAYERAAEQALYDVTFQCSMVEECGGVIPYLYLKAGYSGMPNTQNFHYAVFETQTPSGAKETAAVLVLARQSSSPEGLAPYVFVLTVVTDAIESEVEILSSDEIALSISKLGSASIYGLEFETDEATLLPSSQSAMDELAAYLDTNAEQSVLLVGHTDSQGSLEYNQDLSLRRAVSVRADLIERYSISSDRLTAHGVGYLAPKASNLAPQGRALNRRVEVVAID